MDSFYEQLVTTKKTFTYSLANNGTYVAGVLALMLLGGMQFIFGLIMAAIAVALFFVKKNLYVEYEYDFTNGDIGIDKIMEMKSRKKVINLGVKDIELLAPLGSQHVKDFSNKPDKVLKLYPPTVEEKKLYSAMVTGGEHRVQMIFAPNERFLELCYKYNPRAVKRNL
ncbi:MAG: DUF6106 family protein [Bacillota bacterium]|nr:DUF6106 family protein [Bacillota bacterium]